MELTDVDRAQLGRAIEAARKAQYGTRRAAYDAAGLNSATWARIEEGKPTREDRLARALDLFWPSAHGDIAVVLDSVKGAPEVASEAYQSMQDKAPATQAQIKMLQQQISDLWSAIGEMRSTDAEGTSAQVKDFPVRPLPTPEEFEQMAARRGEFDPGDEDD